MALGTIGVLWVTTAALAQPRTDPGAPRPTPPAPAVKRPTAAASAPPRAGAPGDDNSRATVHLRRAAELYQSGLFDDVVPELQLRRRTDGRRAVAHLAPETVAARLLEVYRQVSGRPGSSPV